MALSTKKSRYVASGIGFSIMLFTLAMQFGHLPGLDTLYKRLELIVYNQRMEAHLPATVEPDQRIVIVDIDEASLRREGHWPWSRRRLAELVERLSDAGAVVIAFDVLFAEAERNPVDTVVAHLAARPDSDTLIRGLQRLAPELNADAYLAERLKRSEVILGYTFDPVMPGGVGQLPAPLPLDNPAQAQKVVMPAMAGYSAPLSVLMNSAAGGFFSMRPDIDGVIRRAPLVDSYDGNFYASLSLETFRRYLFLDKVRLLSGEIDGERKLEFVQLDKHIRIPTDGEGRMLVPYRGHVGSFPYVSAYKVLEGEAGPEQFGGKIVLVGTTAAGLFDLRSTPLDSIYPGVEVHANLISAMLDNRYLVVPSWAKGANLTLGVVVGLILVLVMPRLPLVWLLALALSAAAAVIGLDSWFWVKQGLVLELAGPLLLIAGIAIGNLSWGFFYESLTRHRLKDMFGQYVPPELVDEMSERPDEFDVEGKARELSVLFADIRGFTTISESLSADELKRFLNRFFTPMTRVIFNRNGTIDKYVGDMVMAFWGAPVRDAAHAVHAIEAALDMLAEAQRLREEFAKMGWPEVNIGIGINSGMMSVGDMGSEYRRTYTVLGDAVNLASRLEGTTKYYGVWLVVGERTRELAGDAFVFRELDLVQVKGKAQAIRVYQPVCRVAEADDALLKELKLLEKALALYRGRQWDEADELFAGLQQQQPELRLYAIYRERIGELRDYELDDSWDGVYVRKEK